MASPRVRRQLPRLVEQMRILTWFQFHLSVLILVVAIAAAAILAGSGRSVVSVDEFTRQRLDNVVQLILALTGTAVVLGTAAFMMRRGWGAAFPIVIIGEIAVVADVWLAVRAGLVLGFVLGAATGLLLIFGAWVLAVLFRREVVAFLLR